MSQEPELDIEHDDECEESDQITCWCGETGTYDELFDSSALDHTCGGSGVLYCYCGGDFCVCHYHGEVDCDGCADCTDFDDDDDYDPYEDD